MREHTCFAFQTSSTGMPAMLLLGSSTADELTVSLAPITSTTSVSLPMSLGTPRDQKGEHVKTTKIDRGCRPLEVVVDLLHLQHNIVGHVGLGKQHVQLARHTASNLDQSDGRVRDRDRQRREREGGRETETKGEAVYRVNSKAHVHAMLLKHTSHIRNLQVSHIPSQAHHHEGGYT